MADDPPQHSEGSSQRERAVHDARDTSRIPIWGSFLILLFAALYLAQSFILPVLLAFLFALVLSPVVRACRRLGIPEVLTAVFLVILLGGAIGFATYTLSAPVVRWVEKAPQISWQLRDKLGGSVKELEEAQETIEEATEPEADPGVQEVVVKQPGLVSLAAEGAPEILAGAATTFVLLLFLLASGDMFYEKLVRALPTFKDKRRGIAIARDVEREVSRYLSTISLINAALGAAIAAGLYMVGMPNPILWGIAAAMLNFVPYIGAIVGISIVAVVAIVSYPTVWQALPAPLIYMFCTVVEGQFVTPALVGRRLSINAVAVFLAIAFFGWLWGFVGVFIAVPLLIVIKTYARHSENLSGLHEFLESR